MLEARNRGLPVTIFRPGYVTGDSTTGVMNIDDYLVRLLKGSIQLGKVNGWIGVLLLFSALLTILFTGSRYPQSYQHV